MSDTFRRYNLTLTVVSPSQREAFRALSRPETFFEIRPRRKPGDPGAYRVEMNDAEYQSALAAVKDPDSNLIDIEEDQVGGPDMASAADVPGTPALEYLAAQHAASQGYTGSGVTVGVLDSGLGQALASSMFAGRIKAAKSWVENDSPYNDTNGHGSTMSSLAVPPGAKLAVARFAYGSADGAAAVYWLTDEVAVNIISMSFFYAKKPNGGSSTVFKNAMIHAQSKGVFITISAGNDGGEASNQFPAGEGVGHVISGFDTGTDAKVPGSNYGSIVWAASVWKAITVGKSDGSYASVTNGGTSAATALAARMAAYYMTKNKSLQATESYLIANARKTGASRAHEGNGLLQLSQVVKDPEPKPEPDPITTPKPDPTDPGYIPPPTKPGDPAWTPKDPGACFDYDDIDEAYQIPDYEAMGWYQWTDPATDNGMMCPPDTPPEEPEPEPEPDPSTQCQTSLAPLTAYAITALTTGPGAWTISKTGEGESAFAPPGTKGCRQLDTIDEAYLINALLQHGWEFNSSGKGCAPASWCKDDEQTGSFCDDL